MPSHTPIGSPLGLRALLAASDSIRASKPEKVLKKFINVLKDRSPTAALAIALFGPPIMLIIALQRYKFVTQGCKTLKDFVSSKLTASVSIPGSHPLQKHVMAYMAEQLLKNINTLSLSTPASDKKDFDPFNDEIKKTNKSEEEEKKKERNQLNYVPAVGKYSFSFNGCQMTYEKLEATKEPTTDPFGRATTAQKVITGTIIISARSLFGGVKPIQDFLAHVKHSAETSTEAMTKIFRPEKVRYGFTWDDGVPRPSRTLAAVTLDAEVKDPLVADIEDYLNPSTRKFYISANIPYRRGYLFYGPPGTGKTSFACAMAGQYKLNVYLLSLADPSMNDAVLGTLFDELPNKCIVLLEDIDSAGIKRDEDKPKPIPMRTSQRGQSRRYRSRYDDEEEAPPPQGVTLSALLNALDGIHTKEGRITVLTSNSPDSLDKALIRPGRIDRKVLFGYASQEVAAKLFMRIFTKSPELLLDGEEPFPQDIPALAKAFADLIPSNIITPAEVQGHLLQNRQNPTAAVEKAGQFVKETVEAKTKGRNVASFANEMKAEDTKKLAEAANEKAASEKAASEKAAGGQQADKSSSEDEEDEEDDDRYGNIFDMLSKGNVQFENSILMFPGLNMSDQGAKALAALSDHIEVRTNTSSSKPGEPSETTSSIDPPPASENGDQGSPTPPILTPPASELGAEDALTTGCDEKVRVQSCTTSTCARLLSL